MTDQENNQYCRAALFPNKVWARVAYLKVSKLIDAYEGNLGAYQFHISDIEVVAIIGDHHCEDLDSEIREILDTGTRFDLPDNVFRCLHELFYKESIPGVTRSSRYQPARTLYI